MKSNTTSAYENAHLDIPGNPSTAKSSSLSLNQRENAEPLNCLTEEQWQHWISQGYVVVKAAISKEQANNTANFLWEFEENIPADPTERSFMAFRFFSFVPLVIKPSAKSARPSV